MPPTLLRRVELGADVPPLAENEHPFIEVAGVVDTEKFLVFARTVFERTSPDNFLVVFIKSEHIPASDDLDRLARANIFFWNPPAEYWHRPTESRAQEYFEQLLPKEEPISPPRLTEEERRRNIEYFSDLRFAMSEEDKRTLLDRINNQSREVD